MPTNVASSTNVASQAKRHLRPALHPVRIGFGLRVAAVTAVTALFLGAGAIPALAVPGDVSNAEGQFLSGTLVGLNAALVADLAGEAATSDGTADQTNANNLDLTALGIVNITSVGGIQIPLDLASAGVVSQYAGALADASSVGASGAVSDAGLIGTGITPAVGVAPGSLTLSLNGVVDSLGLPAATLAELANLDLTVQAVSAQAAQAAPAGPTGDYQIDGANLDFDSATIAALVGTIDTSVAALQPTVDNLGLAMQSSLDAALSGLGLGPVVTSLAVSAPDLAGTVDGLTTGTLTSGGVTIDLDSGAISVDLDAFLALNGQLPNTEILTSAVIGQISASILAQLTTLTDSIEAALQAAVNSITVSGSTTELGGSQIVTVDTTAGALLAGDTTGLAVFGSASDVPLADILAPLAVPLVSLSDSINAVGDTVLTPVVGSLLPALEPVLSAALSLTVNNQSNTGDIFTETALRVTVLPALDALTLSVGAAQVGPNVVGMVPVATSLTPPAGPATGGTPVTITGTGFVGTTDVTVDGAPVAFTVVDDTSITFTTVPHEPGDTDVVVTNPIGAADPLIFTFTPVTVVSSIDPATGSEAGGETVTITGTCFTGATDVLFGSTAAMSFVVVDDMTITAVTPAGTGTRNVTVVGAGACSAGTLPDAYTYLPAAVITSLNPVSGPIIGGTTVVITGTGFTGATAVTFDGASAASVLVDSDTQITVTTPAHVAGATDVVVLSPNGDSGPGVFTFIAPPVATSLTPGSGPEVGGTGVTISGSGFTGVTDVSVDGVSVAFVVVDDGTITFTTLAHVPATVPVVVAGPGGSSDPLDFEFTDVPDPVVVSLAPSSGPVAGGVSVIIAGTGFTGATAVTFDGIVAPDFTVDSATQITVTTPAHAVGVTDVAVLSPNGDSVPGEFTFVPVAVLTSMTPAEGLVAGGTVVTLTGSGFTDATDVTFDGVSATDVAVVSDTEITAVSPAHVAATVDVMVLSPGGDSAPLGFEFTIVAAASITGIAPSSGPVAGGTTVVITGSGFTAATGVLFDGLVGTGFVVNSDTQITVVTPAHAAGATDVVVLSPTGNSAPGVFTNALMPIAANLVPDSGPETGGAAVTIAGSAFTGITSVTIDGAAVAFTIVSDSVITITTPMHVPSTVPVMVTGPGGSSDPLDFVFFPVATVISAQGANDGGDLAGTGFTGTVAAGLGILLLLLGGGMLVAVRRRKVHLLP